MIRQCVTSNWPTRALKLTLAHPRHFSIESMPLSALYVYGHHSQKATSSIHPHLDFDRLFANLDRTRASMALRQFDLANCDLEAMRPGYEEYRKLKAWIEAEREREFQQRIKKKGLKSSKDKPEAEEVEAEKPVNPEMKKATARINELSDEMLVRLMHLPNLVHETTEAEDKVVGIYGSLPEAAVSTADLSNFVEFTNVSPGAFYLKNDAAILELALTSFFESRMNRLQFEQTSNSDLTKQLIVEGCGYPTPQSGGLIELLTPRDNLEGHLGIKQIVPGGASLPGLALTLARTYFRLENKTEFDFKYFTIGRHYRVGHSDSQASESLFETVQSTRAYHWRLVNCERAMGAFEDTLEALVAVYNELGMNFQVVQVGGSRLDPAECLRKDIRVFTRTSGYVTVASVGLVDDYISNRLLIQWKNVGGAVRDKRAKYIHIVHGTVANCTALVGAILENGGGAELNVPDVLKPFMF